MKTVLITGGDGHVGHNVGRRLLESNLYKVIFWVRAKDDDSLELKKNKIKELLENKHIENYEVIGGELEKAYPFEKIDSKKVNIILHTAALIKFNITEEEANIVNIEGTRKLLEFAKSCPELDSVNYISSVYAAGEIDGIIGESFHNETEFVNHYERSKCEAELLIKNEFSDLNWRVIRIATVICDDESGNVTQFNVFHNTIRLLYNGLISILPGDKSIPLYLITSRFAVDSICKILMEGNLNEIYHVCHEEDDSSSLEDLINHVFETFKEYDSFVKKRILPPIFVNEKTFTTMSDRMESFSETVVTDALKSIRPFSRQLFINKKFDIKNNRQIYKDYHAPDAKKLIQNTTRFLVNTKWGRVPLDR